MADARYEKVRTRQGLVSQAVMLVVSIAEDGHRAILSVDIGDSENESSRDDVFKNLKNCGLRGLVFAVSDAIPALSTPCSAISRGWPGSAARCTLLLS